MNIEQLKTNIAAANNLVTAVKEQLYSTITAEMRNIDNGDGKRKFAPIEDVGEDGIDFRTLNEEGHPLDASFSPDNAIDEDEAIIGITLDKESGIPILWSHDEDSGEVDDVPITQDRLSMDDLLEVLKIIAIWNK